MGRVAIKNFSGFHQRFGQGGMRMNGQGEVFSSGAHLDRQNAFGNQLSGAMPHNPYPEDALTIRLDDQLGQTFRPIESQSAAGSRQGELRDPDLSSFLSGIGLSQS